jgi:hypothetical protein
MTTEITSKKYFSQRIGEAALQEYQKTGTLGQETANTAVVVGARWAGAFSGATLGGQAGLVIGMYQISLVFDKLMKQTSSSSLFAGTLAGTLCFGMAVPGAAVGSLVGGLWCGVAGGAAATNMAQSMTKSDVGYMRLVY